MYIHGKLFFKALRLGLFERSFGFRHRLMIVGFVVLYLVMWVVTAVGRALDHVLFPGFRKQEIREPLFIIALPRSGTTLTQKLIALDTGRFSHITLLHTIFPSVTYYRLFTLADRVNRLVGSPAQHVLRWLEKRFFGGWDHTHPLRFTEPEEDIGFYAYPFLNEAVYLLFPYVKELWGAGFHDSLSAEERRELMRYYRSCLQRHQYVYGAGRTLLSKSTQSSGTVRSLLETFPDARILTVVRDPHESIASHVSVFYPAWRTYAPQLGKDSPASREYAGLAVEWLKHLFDSRGFISPDRYYCLRYTDLVADPAAAIRGVYDHFKLSPDRDFLARLDAAGRKSRKFRSSHRYSLEEFGLDREWLRGELGHILDHYGLPGSEREADATED
jgi:hypothetical protein